MTKVYLVFRSEYDKYLDQHDDTVVGIYDSQEKASEYIESQKGFQLEGLYGPSYFRIEAGNLQ